MKPPVIIFVALLSPNLCSAQITPTFASASITPNTSQETTSSYNTHPGKLTIRNKSLKDCIRLAYGVKIARPTSLPCCRSTSASLALANGIGVTGMGCVGEVASPGTSL